MLRQTTRSAICRSGATRRNGPASDRFRNSPESFGPSALDASRALGVGHGVVASLGRTKFVF
jgi:hypothetical protein